MADTMVSGGQKKPILDQGGTQLTNDNSAVFSSDNSIVSIEWNAGQVAVSGKAGTATLTATRKADGATAIDEVTVELAPFSISLGAAL